MKKDGSCTYSPKDYFVESDTFRYVVTDGLYYDTAEVTLARLVSGVDIASIIEINPIYFDLNKSNIREDAATELLKIVEIMNEYTSMVVELGSHTDCRASQGYNRNLSDRRAKSSTNFIKERILILKGFMVKVLGIQTKINVNAKDLKLLLVRRKSTRKIDELNF